MSDIEDKTLLHQLMPSSIAEEDVFKNAATALHADSDTKAHLNDGLFYYLLDSASSSLLDHLALQWRVGVWRDSWPVSRKRLVLKTIIKTLSHYGTKKAIIDVLASLGNGAYITEWFETTPKLTPHTFQINIDLNVQQVESDALDDAITALNLVKPVRSQFEVNQFINFKCGLQLNPALRQFSFTRVSVEPIKETELSVKSSIYPNSRIMAYTHIPAPDTIHSKVTVDAKNYVSVRTSSFNRS